MTDEKIRSTAEGHCDRIVDERGRETFEFDDHGLINFARAIEGARDEAQR